MKQLFPIYLSIITINIILFLVINKKGKRWSGMTNTEKKTSIILISLGTLILISGVAALFLTKE